MGKWIRRVYIRHGQAENSTRQTNNKVCEILGISNKQLKKKFKQVRKEDKNPIVWCEEIIAKHNKDNKQ